MKKNLLTVLLTIISICLLSINQNANSQCKWQQKLYDGYEYSTTVPDLIPGTTIQTTPQSFAVHTGTKSLYMNFINTLPGGSLVYDRTITVCANVPIQISAWLTTSFRVYNAMRVSKLLMPIIYSLLTPQVYFARMHLFGHSINLAP
ncbi:MAG: hypothetical protein IPP29_10280 [Bacteroidetes bacterium]|nr:hypothetical protein [Bacteroidota bacterium]